MYYEIQLDLILSNFDVEPDQISSLLSIQPSKCWLKDEFIQKTALRRKTNGWLLSSGLDKSAEFDVHVDALLAKIKPILKKFADLPSSTCVELSCAVYIYSSGPDEEHNTPALHLDSEHMKILAQLEAAFDIDLYVLPG